MDMILVKEKRNIGSIIVLFVDGEKSMLSE